MALSKTVDDLTILGSDSEKGDLCAACAGDGDYRPAIKFCLDCSQPICQACVDSHRKIKMIQGHKLVDNKNEDAVKIAKSLSSCLACPNHADKTIEFMCLDHNAFCCSTCATVNHRGCRQIKEVAALAQMSPNTTTTVTHLNDAKVAIEELVRLRQKNNNDIREQVSKIIPKQIEEMKASIMKTFDELERYLLRETNRLAGSLRAPNDSEIVRWQSQLKIINEASNLISATQQNGTDVHKYIAAKNTEKKLAEIDDYICAAEQIIDSLSFSFDKMAFLQNASVVVTSNINEVAATKSLADVDGEVQTSYSQDEKKTDRTYYYPTYKIKRQQNPYAGQTQGKQNPFARLYTNTTAVQTLAYRHGKPQSRTCVQKDFKYGLTETYGLRYYRSMEPP